MTAATSMSGVDSAAVSLVGLTKWFGSLTVVAPLDLVIAPGSFVSIVGPSGCGKSTLLRLVAGLEVPSAGTVSLDGQPARHSRTHKRVAVVPQQPGLLPWRTVLQNARLLLDINPQVTTAQHPDPLALLHDVGLGEFLHAYPRQLSGGMQQRVAIVRAFALGAPLVVMDEPFAALDEISRTEMRAMLAALLEHHPATVVFVTHSIDEAAFLSDRVLVCSPRPATIVADVAVNLPRPRTDATHDADRFVQVCAELRHHLRTAMRR